jgi:Zn-dependent protease
VQDLPPLPEILAIAIVLFLGIGLHEYAHCKVADLSGDPTPRLMGRVTLNLTKHFEPSGVFMMILSSLSGYGIGWGKPAPADMSKMHNPRWDGFMTVLAGPLTNLLQAGVYAMMIRVGTAGGTSLGQMGWFGILLQFGLAINVRLAMFNFIPVGLLDGHWLVGLLMPERPRYYWFRFNRSYGIVLMIALVIGSQYMENRGMASPLKVLVDRPSDAIVQFLLGPRFKV